MLAEFDLVMPADLDAALAVLADGGDGTMPLAGGTNLVVDLRARQIEPDRLVGLGRLRGLRGIDRTNGHVVMGAGTTISDVLRDSAMAQEAPALVEAARWFGGQMVRNAATLAGNLCYGSPAADMVPPLLVLDAEVTLQSTAGSRRLSLADFHRGYRQTARRSDELLTQITWPQPQAGSANAFYKLSRRKGDAITVVGVAVALTIEADRCRRARIALGAVAPTVIRARAAEQMLEGEVLTPALIDAAARQAVEAARPIDDVRASAEYRRHAVHVLTRRLLEQVRARLS